MRNKLIVIIVVVFLLGGLAFYFIARQPAAVNTYTPAASPSSTTSAPQAATSSLVAPALKSQPGTTASITSVTMSTKLASSGAALSPKTSFLSTDPVIYAVLSVKNTTRYTELAYVRYYDGKYVDSKVSHLTSDGMQYFHFNWTLRLGQTRKTGNYTLNFYVNGARAQSVEYVIR